VPLNLLIG